MVRLTAARPPKLDDIRAKVETVGALAAMYHQPGGLTSGQSAREKRNDGFFPHY